MAAGRLAFGLTASAFRHAPLRGCSSAGWFFCLPLRSCRSAGWPSGSRLPLFGTHRFGVAARRVDLRAHRFRFSARTASGLPSASWCFRLPFRRWPPSGWPSGSPLPLFGLRRFGVALGELVLLPPVSAFATRRVGLRTHCFRFSARTASGLLLGGLTFGFTASAFRHAPLRDCPRRVGSSAFRFGVCHSAGWFFCLPLRRLPLGGLAFGLTASAFRHAPLRRLPSAS